MRHIALKTTKYDTAAADPTTAIEAEVEATFIPAPKVMYLKIRGDEFQDASNVRNRSIKYAIRTVVGHE